MPREKNIARGIRKDDSELSVGVISQMAPLAILLATNPNPEKALLAASATGFITLIAQKYKANLAEYVRSFSRKCQGLSESALDHYKTRVKDPDGEQFFATAWWQAAETIDQAKIDAIASLVKNSLTSKELKIHDAQWLLRLIDQLDDVELILLQFHTQKINKDQDFLRQHTAILNGAKKPQYPSSGNYNDNNQNDVSLEERERLNHEFADKMKVFKMQCEYHAIYINRIAHLVGMGLLGERTERTTDTDIAQYEALSSLQLTQLGAALLKITDLAEYDEWGSAEQIDAVRLSKQARQSGESARKSVRDFKAYTSR